VPANRLSGIDQVAHEYVKQWRGENMVTIEFILTCLLASLVFGSIGLIMMIRVQEYNAQFTGGLDND
jgi:hypothetical protein